MNETLKLRKYMDHISEFCLLLQERVKRLEKMTNPPKADKGKCKIYKMKIIKAEGL